MSGLRNRSGGRRPALCGSLAAVALCLALLLGIPSTAGSATAGDQRAEPARAAQLVHYVTHGRIAIGPKVSYRFRCSADCHVIARATLVLTKFGGACAGTIKDFRLEAGQVQTDRIDINTNSNCKPPDLRRYRGKLKTTLRAKPLPNDGRPAEVVKRSFRFKR